MKKLLQVIFFSVIKQRWFLTLLLFALLLVPGKIFADARQVAIRELGQDTVDFPYHPLVYHLDLSILAYQLYSQTITWPFDPYYEMASKPKKRRVQLMDSIRVWANARGAEQVKGLTGFQGYRGPGVLNGFEDNTSHDPIIYRYDQIYPWSSSITNADGKWTEYLTPTHITRRIRTVYVSYRKTGFPDSLVVLDSIASQAGVEGARARDILLAFEGGTGDKDEPGQPASQSLMGFVLVRYRPGSDNYDVHIAFRGSRSGSASRAVAQAIKTEKASGNPDWITDLGFRLIGTEEGGGHISTIGKVHRGMAKAMESIYPQLYRCLREVVTLSANKVPEEIYVTGHSLGGALAQQFVSSVLLGDNYGPDGSGPYMSPELRAWPWKQIKMITFGAPRVGDEAWARELTTNKLMTDFYDSKVFTLYDKNYLKTTDPEILFRLLDKNRPAGYRVLISTDPITAAVGKLRGDEHTGKTIYVNKPCWADFVKFADFKSHEPARIRNFLIKSLKDTLVPPVAWRYHAMREWNPGWKKNKRGTTEEYRKLADAIEKYYSDNQIEFDHEVFNSNLNLFLGLLPDQ